MKLESKLGLATYHFLNLFLCHGAGSVFASETGIWQWQARIALCSWQIHISSNVEGWEYTHTHPPGARVQHSSTTGCQNHHSCLSQFGAMSSNSCQKSRQMQDIYAEYFRTMWEPMRFTQRGPINLEIFNSNLPFLGKNLELCLKYILVNATRRSSSTRGCFPSQFSFPHISPW